MTRSYSKSLCSRFTKYTHFGQKKYLLAFRLARSFSLTAAESHSMLRSPRWNEFLTDPITDPKNYYSYKKKSDNKTGCNEMHGIRTNGSMACLNLSHYTILTLTEMKLKANSCTKSITQYLFLKSFLSGHWSRHTADVIKLFLGRRFSFNE